ncbi:MAG: hypothetical protein Ta2B_05550 [Termitinemataceae bacterium]|nr:MAG: hypothetical protein Ta2B_05550 [Termitinemataceae bacterium]
MRNISIEEIAKEIKVFKNTDFSDCPILTEEQMKHFRPSHLRPQSRIKIQVPQTEEVCLKPELATV